MEKRLFRKHGILLAFVFVFGLAFASCWTTGSVNEPTQFEGRWFDPADAEKYGFSDFSFTFAGDTFIFRMIFIDDNLQDRIISGTFKFKDDIIRFTSGKQKWTQPYSLNGGQLRLRVSDNPYDRNTLTTGLFVKQ